MRPEDVHAWLRRDPFVPFRIHLSNGRTFEDRHPELVMVGRTSLVIGDRDPDFAIPVFDAVNLHVALMHINHIEPLAPSAPQPTG